MVLPGGLELVSSLMTSGSPTETLQLTTSDGVTIEGELAVPENPVALAVICHPHPLYGGNMHNNVVGAMFNRLTADGVCCLRFNFRGVDGSGGQHGEGRDESQDIVAAIDVVAAREPDLPVILAGYSFGADVALSVGDQRVSAWLAVAPPMRVIAPETMVAASDPRPKSMITGSKDDFRPPDQLREVVADWANCQVSVADGASHFFATGLHAVQDAASALVTDLTGG